MRFGKRRDTELWHSPHARQELLRRRLDAPTSTIQNILKVPANDGILLSTGNLEDVTADGSSMTGLNIKNDLHVHGWLQFGSGGHAGSCGWTECSDASHVQTNGIQLPTQDLVQGWEQRNSSMCSESELGLPTGFLASPSEWRTLNNSCWDSKFGSYCFQLQESQVEECLGTCTSQSCSLIFASSFRLAHLINTVKTDLSAAAGVTVWRHLEGASSARKPVEAFVVECRPDPLKTDSELCLYFFRMPFEEETTPGSRRQTREYIAGGMDIGLEIQLEWARQNLTDTRSAQRDVYDVFQCFNKACYLEGNVQTDFSAQIDSEYCDTRGMTALFRSGEISFRGQKLSCTDLEAAFQPCETSTPPPQEEGEPMQAATELCLDLFHWQDTFPDLVLAEPVVPSPESLQMVYDALETLRGIHLESIEKIKLDIETERTLAQLEGKLLPSLEERPHLWQLETTNKSSRFRWYGYCDAHTFPRSSPPSCAREGSVITAVDFASYGVASGQCGDYRVGTCAIDLTFQLKGLCQGKSECSTIPDYSHQWKQLPARCRDGGASPSLQFQFRCSNGPFLTMLGGELGVSYDAVIDAEEAAVQGPLYKPSRQAQIRAEAVSLALDHEEKVRCAMAKASPAMVQAHMCSAQENFNVNTYVYKGFEAELKLLLESAGGAGRSSVLRFQSLRTSNESVSETEVLFPATNGIMLTTGNLEDITVESGAMTSMAVSKKSFLKGGITVGPLEPSTIYSAALEQHVQESWWDGGSAGSDGRPRSEGGAKWDWTTGGPWLTLFAPGDCKYPQTECTEDNVDRAIKFNVSDGGVTRVDFEVMEGVVSQIQFPVTWGVRQGDVIDHGYSHITGGSYTQHLCSADEVLFPDPEPWAKNSECVSRIITTGNLHEIRNLSATTVKVSGTAALKGPVLLGSGQAVEMLPAAARPPPGSSGEKLPSEHQWVTHESIWEESTSQGLKDCSRPSTHPTAKCGGSLESPGVSPVVLEGSIQGDLFYRNVPRDRLASSLHSRTASAFLGEVFEPLTWMEFSQRKCLLPSASDFQGVYALEKGPVMSQASVLAV